MTEDRPGADSLLETAMEVLRETFLPDAQGERRLDLLMVLSVLGLVQRSLADSSDSLAARRSARFAALLGTQGDMAALAHDIRSGAWDGPEAAKRLHDLLSEDLRDRLARSNPKYLAVLEQEESR